MAKDIAPQQVATMVFDESGTPIIGVDRDRRFVVGGFVVRGDADALAAAWHERRSAMGIGEKGWKFGDEELATVVDFAIEHAMLPITSLATLSDADEDELRAKIAALDEFGEGLSEKIKAAPYAWVQQVSMTIVPGLLGSAVTWGGKLRSLHVAIDRFDVSDRLSRPMHRVLARVLDDARAVVRTAAESREIEDEGHVKKAIANLQIETCTIDLRASGELRNLADAIAGLFRRAYSGESEAERQAERLKAAYRTENRKLACMDLDLTGDLQKLIKTPWPKPVPAPPEDTSFGDAS